MARGTIPRFCCVCLNEPAIEYRGKQYCGVCLKVVKHKEAELSKDGIDIHHPDKKEPLDEKRDS